MYREGQRVAAGDRGHVDDLAGLALEGQGKAKLRQERLQRSPQQAISAHADPMSSQQQAGAFRVQPKLGAYSEPSTQRGRLASQQEYRAHVLKCIVVALRHARAL